MADIFFSYAKVDRDRVQPLIESLETEWTVWWDHDLTVGESWSAEILTELNQARCAVVAWTQASIKSEFVLDEARRAHKVRKLIPVMFDLVELPMGFGGLQAADFSKWNGKADAAEFIRLRDAIQRRLNNAAQVARVDVAVPAHAHRLETSSVIQTPFPPVVQAPPPPHVESPVHAIRSTDQRQRWLIVASITIGFLALLTAGLLMHFHFQKVFVANVQLALCIPDANGVAGASTIAAVRNYLQGTGHEIPANIDLKSAELEQLLQAAVDDVGNCAAAGFKNAFEVGYFGVPANKRDRRTQVFQNRLSDALRNRSGNAIAFTGKMDAATRMGIVEFRRMSNLRAGDQVDFELVQTLLKFDR